jgi:ABC-type phosphate transport system substrate-binding protein
MRLLLLLLALSLAQPASAAAELAIIVNKVNTAQVSQPFAFRAFLGFISRWPSRGSIMVVALPEEHAATRLLYGRLLNKKPMEVHDFWAQNFFTGKCSMPKEVTSEEEVKRIVRNYPNAIGYIDSAAVDETVKVVLRVK